MRIFLKGIFIFCSFLIFLASFCVAILGAASTQAQAEMTDPFFNRIKNIVIVANSGLQADDSEGMHQKIIDQYPVLSEENIQKMAVDIFPKNLHYKERVDGKIKMESIKIYTPKSSIDFNNYPFDYGSYIVSLSLGIRDIEIEGKVHTIGSIYLRLYRLNPDFEKNPVTERYAFFPESAGWLPVEPFLISGDNEDVKRSLKTALRRILASAIIKGD
ncbi:MAG: hypothetical protein ACXW30_00630 [Micavibrio sp.]